MASAEQIKDSFIFLHKLTVPVRRVSKLHSQICFKHYLDSLSRILLGKVMVIAVNTSVETPACPADLSGFYPLFQLLAEENPSKQR